MFSFWNWNDRDSDEEDDDASHYSTDSDDFVYRPKKKSKRTNQREKDEDSIKEKIYDIVKDFEKSGAATGDYMIHGELPNPPLVVIEIKKDKKRLTFPMNEKDVDSITNYLKPSHYGRGTETVLDTSFRKSFELEPKDFKIINDDWTNFISKTVVPKIKLEMMIKSNFKAKLHKLLFYKPGSFFKRHKDSEKEPGMFGTLVIQLPSEYTGGQLNVYHEDKMKTADFSTEKSKGNMCKTYFSSFYADCDHEVLELKSGVRTCLVYNLVVTGKNTTGMIPKPYASGSVEDRLATVLREWKGQEKPEPSKVVLQLSHEYTEKNLSFNNLKSTDRDIAFFLSNVAKDVGCICFLAIYKKQTNILDTSIDKLDKNGGCNRPKKVSNDHSEDDGDDDDLVHRYYELTNLIPLGEKHINMAGRMKSVSITIDFEEEVPVECFWNLKPYDREAEGSGNEGVTVDLFYRHAAIAVFPADTCFRALALPQKNEDGKPTYDTVVKMFLEDYKESPNHESEELLEKAFSVAPSGDKELFSIISKFNNSELMKKYLENFKLKDLKEVPLIVSQCEKYGWDTFSTAVMRIFKKAKKSYPDIRLKAIEVIVGDHISKNKPKKALCRNLLRSYLDDPEEVRDYSYSSNETGKHVSEETLENVLKISKKLKCNVDDFVKTQKIATAVPVLVKLAKNTGNVLDPHYLEIWSHFVTLAESKACKRTIVVNWIRNDFVSCGGNCEDCRKVDQFMKADQQQFRFKIPQSGTYHIVQRLNRMKNISHKTESVSHDRNTQILAITKDKKLDDDFQEQLTFRKFLSQLKALVPQ